MQIFILNVKSVHPFFDYLCLLYRDCNSWSNENRINLQIYHRVNTHQHWLALRGEDGSADGLWSSTYEVVTVSGSKFGRAVALFAACLLTPLSLGTVLSEPQDDPLGPRCSSAAALAPLQPQSRRTSVRGAHSCSRPSSRWSPGRRRGGRMGTQLNQGGVGVSRWLLWLSPGADGRPWWSVSAPLSLRWVSRWETFYFCLYDVQFGDKCKISLHYLAQQDVDLVFIFTGAFCCRTSGLLWPPPVEVAVHFQAPSTRPGSYMNQKWPLCLKHIGRHPGPCFVGKLRNMTHIWCYAFRRERSSSSAWLPDARA